MFNFQCYYELIICDIVSYIYDIKSFLLLGLLIKTKNVSKQDT